MTTLLEFSASWCHPCKTQEPILAQFKQKHPEVKVQVYKVDEPAAQRIAEQYEIRMVPSFVVLDKQGTPRAVTSGLQTIAQIEKLVQQAL